MLPETGHASRLYVTGRVARWAWLVGCLLTCLILFSVAHARVRAVRPVIELSRLKTLLAKHTPKLLLVDVRRHAAYLRGHLPGAINLPAALTLNQAGRNGIASLRQVRKILSRAGIRQSDYLVLYDNGLLKDAAHVFWVLETYGDKTVSVLNSGYPGWVANKGMISRRVTTLPPSHYQPSIQSHRLSTELATLLAVRNHHVQIIDARSRREFLGLASRARRKGHILNAINVPWSENLARTRPYPRLKSRKALHALYWMLRPGEHAIAYCNRSMESAVTYLALRWLGYPVSVFDGAWLEWGNDNHLPIETGPANRKLAHVP